MNADDRELARLTKLLGQVLERIDAHAHDLTRLADADPRAAALQLEEDAEQLQQLVDDLVTVTVAGSQAEWAHLNATAASCLRTLMQRLEHPLVVRQQLEATPDAVHCSPAQLAHALQRALTLAAAHAGHGGEIIVTSSRHGSQLRLEVACSGNGGHHLAERTQTLREFVADLRGTVEVHMDNQSSLLLVLAFPAAVGLDHRG